MKFQGIAVLLIVAVAIAVFSYKLGQRDLASQESGGVGQDVAAGNVESGSIQQTVAAPEVRALGAGGKAGFTPGGRIAHFEIGNRNVKGLFAEPDRIWLATSGGVIRYDTASDDYAVFDNTTPGILSNGIFHVSKFGDRIVAGSYGGGMSVLDPESGKWKNYNIPQGLADQFVYDTVLASNGDFWIATWSGANRVIGGNLDDPGSWETFTVENTGGGLPNPWVYGVEEGVNGEMWFATEAGLARYKDGDWENWQHDDGLGAPFESVRKAIQFTNDPAKASKHHAQQKSEQGLEGVDVAYNPNYIISLEVDDEGSVWCGTWGGGLARFDGKKWQNFTTADGLPGNHIFMLYKDPQGTLWAGTSKGLATMNKRDGSFKTLTVADGLYANNVFSMANAQDGSVWIGSFGGVARFGSDVWRR